MPLESRVFLSGASHRPCPDGKVGSPSDIDMPGAVLPPSAPGSLPTVELRRQLARLNETYLGLNDFTLLMAWATQPDPVRTCQILGNLIDQCNSIIERTTELRRHAMLLWDLSYEESRRRA